MERTRRARLGQDETSEQTRITRATADDRRTSVQRQARFDSVVQSAERRARFVIKPMLGPNEGIDVTDALQRAIAQELWKFHGGNDVVNWLEAEAILQRLFNRKSETKSKHA